MNGRNDAIRRLWIEALATGRRELDGVDLPRLQARREHEIIRSVVTAAAPDDEGLGDVLFLAFCGYSLSATSSTSGRPGARRPRLAIRDATLALQERQHSQHAPVGLR